MKNRGIIIVVITLFNSICWNVFSQQRAEIEYYQVKTNKLFNSSQIISYLKAPNDIDDILQIDLSSAYDSLELTSELAKRDSAVVAINGGFFDVAEGGSVSYIEIDNQVIDTTRNPQLKWSKPNSVISGAIVIDTVNNLTIEKAKSDEFYSNSNLEEAVLVTGPLLIDDNAVLELDSTKFVTTRHPRSCLCTTEESIYFITVDGRSEQADGMSLFELQAYLKEYLNCTDAINLDGGGSSTLWYSKDGILNYPSDKSGERKVSNAIIIRKKNE